MTKDEAAKILNLTPHKRLRDAEEFFRASGYGGMDCLMFNVGPSRDRILWHPHDRRFVFVDRKERQLRPCIGLPPEELARMIDGIESAVDAAWAEISR